MCYLLCLSKVRRTTVRSYVTGSTGKLVHSPTGNNASIFSEFPVARNVSIQSTVEFTCAVPNGEYVLLYFSVGNLTSTEVDHCTLHLTWTAPYTLQGVPILNYTITINPDIRSDSDTFSTSTVEYLYRPDALGKSNTI